MGEDRTMQAQRSLTRIAPAFIFSVGIGLVGCSSDSESKSASNNAPPEVQRPEGPAAHVVGQLTGGNGVLLAAASPQTVPDGWLEEEYALDGLAVSYAAQGTLPSDGRFMLVEAGSADYRTRIVVRRPSAAADFNGTVIVEWLNVSGGFDADPDFTFMANEIYRKGYAWVGVSAQYVGIEGGPVLVSTPMSDQAGAGKGLRALDPVRYGELHHPGDAFCYDIYTQVARTLRLRGDAGVLGNLVPTRILAVGESQSAFMLTTYADGIQPLAEQYDGFLIHSRGGTAAPLGQAGSGIDLASAIVGTSTLIRTDLTVPVLIIETETDLLSVIDYYPARQPDEARVQTWEMAGTAHADTYLVGSYADQMGCTVPINDGPQHFMVKSALRHLDAWSREGAPPPVAGRLEIQNGVLGPSYIRNQDGIVLGGVRTPEVDVPVDVLSGDAVAGGSIACMLFGSTTPLSAARIAALYPSPQAYLAEYTQSADAAIAAGFVLAEDRNELLADADPSRVGP